MFICITGEPGSGKSAYAVDYILKHKDEYKSVYVNINGFKMYDNIKSFNYNNMYDILSKCKDIYDEQISSLGNSGEENTIDEPIVRYLLTIGFLSINPAYQEYIQLKHDRKKEKPLKKFVQNMRKPIKKVSEYLPTLFVIDEVQNHMGAIDPNTGKELRTADPVLSWWVSYHRHLYMDVLILSQQYQKIHIAYRRDVSYFLDAVESQSLLLGKYSPNLVYNKYKETPYTEKKKTTKVKVKKTPALFKAYQSGDAVRSKSVLLPYILIALFAIIILIIMITVIADSFSKGKEDKKKETSTKEKVIKLENTQIIETKTQLNSNSHYISLDCISDICINKKNNIKVDIDDLEQIAKITDSSFLQVKKHSATLATITILASEEFINLFQGAYNEKKEKGFSIIN